MVKAVTVASRVPPTAPAAATAGEVPLPPRAIVSIAAAPVARTLTVKAVVFTAVLIV